YVAKKIFRLGQPPNYDMNVLSSVNEEQLKAELQRIKTLDWFLTNFFKEATRLHVEVAHIEVVDAYIAQEVDQQNFWLIEPCRTSVVNHYSGTMNHPSQAHDGPSATLLAFAHFVYIWSKEQVVFADLQGVLLMFSGQDGVVLFDPMMHTVNMTGGLGDHGPAGIAKFLEDHSCHVTCAQLGFTEKLKEDDKVDSDSG
ncbi:hypothetical protein M422DRAFT_185152, partial [Sphaerobolus stellatus SS14]